jgi:hypothetical protein
MTETSKKQTIEIGPKKIQTIKLLDMDFQVTVLNMVNEHKIEDFWNSTGKYKKRTKFKI